MRSVLLVLLLALTGAFAASQCHYSCSTCSSNYYTKCLKCSDASFTLNAGPKCGVKTEQTILTKLGGLCGPATYSGINPIGLILIFAALISFFLKSSHTVFFVISFQTLGLLALV